VRLSVFTDEIAPELGRALDVCEELGIRAVELRTVDAVQIVNVPSEELAAMRDELDRRGFTVCAIASPFLKCGRNDDAADQEAVHERALAAAAIFDAPIVRAFSYWREPDPSSVLPQLGEALRKAVRPGVTLALENEYECNVATAPEARAALDDADGVRLIWDAGNVAMLDPAAYAGLGGLELVIDDVVHVHVKDVSSAGEWTRIGDGIVDFGAQLRYLDDAGYDGAISFETHYQRDGSVELATRDCVAALRALGVSFT
jgi:L-ribulose-5-phosphate 3-epimerase